MPKPCAGSECDHCILPGAVADHWSTSGRAYPDDARGGGSNTASGSGAVQIEPATTRRFVARIVVNAIAGRGGSKAHYGDGKRNRSSARRRGSQTVGFILSEKERCGDCACQGVV